MKSNMKNPLFRKLFLEEIREKNLYPGIEELIKQNEL